MAKKLVPDAKPYCLFQVSGDGDHAFPMCGDDYHWPLEEAKQFAVCPVCERQVKWPSDIAGDAK